MTWALKVFSGPKLLLPDQGKYISNINIYIFEYKTRVIIWKPHFFLKRGIIKFKMYGSFTKYCWVDLNAAMT